MVRQPHVFLQGQGPKSGRADHEVGLVEAALKSRKKILAMQRLVEQRVPM